MNKEKNFISAVIYVKDSEKYVKKFIEKINGLFNEKFLNYELVFVNDASKDKTVEYIKEVIANLNKVNTIIINMSFYQGKENAMNAGLDMASGDFVYEFDDVNLDYNIELVLDAYKKALEGFDIVNVGPNKKYLSSKIFYKVFNNYSNFQYKLDSNTFMVLSRRAINRMNSINKFVPYRKAILANIGLKLIDIKYKPVSKIKKIDKKLKKERNRNAIDSLILFTDISYKISIFLTCIMLFIIVCVSIYTITVFTLDKPVKGWTTTMLFLSMGFSGIFLLYTIIIKYLSIIINLIFKKVNYLIESVEKLY